MNAASHHKFSSYISRSSVLAVQVDRLGPTYCPPFVHGQALRSADGYALVVNLKVAKTMGPTISPSFLTRMKVVPQQAVTLPIRHLIRRADRGFRLRNRFCAGALNQADDL